MAQASDPTLAITNTKNDVDQNCIWTMLRTSLGNDNTSILQSIFDKHIPLVTDLKTLLKSKIAQQDLQRQGSKSLGLFFNRLFQVSVEYYDDDDIVALVHTFDKAFRNLTQLNKV